MSPPIDPRRGVRVAAAANYEQARRRKTTATVWLAERSDELELELDEPDKSTE